MAFIKSHSFYDSLVGVINLLLSAKGEHGPAVSAAAAKLQQLKCRRLRRTAKAARSLALVSNFHSLEKLSHLT